MRTPNRTPEWYWEQIKQAEKIVDSWPEWKREAAAAEFDALLDEFQPGVTPRDKESI